MSISVKTIDNNKRIAKNTLILYLRMFLVMGITIYTSRVILEKIGVVDYGIYNVVGSIVALIDFLNSAMAQSTSRFITYELGRKNKSLLAETFSLSLNTHLLIALIIFVLGETIGLWYLNNYIVIPTDRTNAAFWVYQISIAASIVVIWNVPYNATIIAHEKMSAFAFVSIIDVVLQLIVVFSLSLSKIDKLIYYALCLLLIKFICRIIYGIYCSKNFEECKFQWYWNKSLFKKMFSFAIWSIIGELAAVGTSQGLNLMLNLFFGPIVNAARAIVSQVQSAIMRFIVNFQIALNPQIIKNYAINDLNRMHELIYSSSRLSFFLLLLISFPVWLLAPGILELWLKTVPEHTVLFFRISIFTSLLDSFSNPLIVAAKATGKIKTYQTVIGGILLLILPISYLFLKLGFAAESVFVIQFVISLVAMFARVYLVRTLISLSIRQYISKVVLKVIWVLLLVVGLTIILYPYIGKSALNMLVICLICICSMTCFIYFLGLETVERVMIRNKVHLMISHL